MLLEGNQIENFSNLDLRPNLMPYSILGFTLSIQYIFVHESFLKIEEGCKIQDNASKHSYLCSFSRSGKKLVHYVWSVKEFY